MCSARSRTSAPASISPSSDGVSRTATAPGPNGSIDEAVARKLLGAREQALDVGLVELDDLGDQQDLARDAGLLQRRLQPLVDEALVRGVLVDDDDAVAGLRDDIGLVHLRARGAERPVEQVGRRLGDLDARVGRRAADIEGRLRRFGKADGAAATRRAPPRIADAPASAPIPGPARRMPAGRNAAMVALPPVVAARCPSRASASCSARTISARTSAGSRKRTSALAGCTLTSTSRGSSVDEQRHDRMAVARQVVGVGAAHRAEQQLVAHRPAVDEQILRRAHWRACRSAAPRSLDRDAVASAADLDRVGAELGAENVGEPGEPPGRAGQRRRPGDRRALLAGEREGDVGPAHGEPAHHLADRFAPRRGRS